MLERKNYKQFGNYVSIRYLTLEVKKKSSNNKNNNKNPLYSMVKQKDGLDTLVNWRIDLVLITSCIPSLKTYMTL